MGMSSVVNRSRQLLNKFVKGTGRRYMHIEDPVQMEKSIERWRICSFYVCPVAIAISSYIGIKEEMSHWAHPVNMLNILTLTSEIRNFLGVTETILFSTTHKETGSLELAMKKIWRIIN